MSNVARTIFNFDPVPPTPEEKRMLKSVKMQTITDIKEGIIIKYKIFKDCMYILDSYILPTLPHYLIEP